MPKFHAEGATNVSTDAARNAQTEALVTVPPDDLGPDSNPRIQESGCFLMTHEKKYYEILNPDGKTGTIVKRSLTPSEYQHNDKGALFPPFFAKERLQNEVAAIAYVKTHLPGIPVPVIRCYFEDHGRFYVIMDIAPGVALAQLPDDKKSIPLKELEGYLSRMRATKSNTLRAFGQRIFLPYRLFIAIPEHDRTRVSSVTSDTEDFVLCHNDLSQHNVIVDPNTLKITAILDWEYSGFFPSQFEYAFWRRPGPSVILEQNGEHDDRLDLLTKLSELGAL